jgi:acetolactate synthase-1/2/3 large subunit
MGVWQEIFYNKKYSATVLEFTPDFVKLAEAYGVIGLTAEKPEEVGPVIEKALSIKKPVIMDFKVEKEECVYPMVPAGAAISKMLLV